MEYACFTHTFQTLSSLKEVIWHTQLFKIPLKSSTAHGCLLNSQESEPEMAEIQKHLWGYQKKGKEQQDLLKFKSKSIMLPHLLPV